MGYAEADQPPNQYVVGALEFCSSTNAEALAGAPVKIILGDKAMVAGSPFAELTAEELDATELLDEDLVIDDELATEDDELAMDELELATE